MGDIGKIIEIVRVEPVREPTKPLEVPVEPERVPVDE